MGSNMVLTYANVFMMALEEQHIYTSILFSHVKVWWRYIDDVFVIWSGTQQDLETFFSTHNQMDEDIKFMMVISTHSLQFLDTLFYIQGDILYSLLYSQLLRVKRVVQDPKLLECRVDDMCHKFTSRGYPTQLVKKYRTKVNEFDRQNLLWEKEHVPDNQRITFVSTYSPVSNKIREIIHMEWHILSDTMTDIELFKNTPLHLFFYIPGPWFWFIGHAP